MSRWIPSYVRPSAVLPGVMSRLNLYPHDSAPLPLRTTSRIAASRTMTRATTWGPSIETSLTSPTARSFQLSAFTSPGGCSSVIVTDSKVLTAFATSSGGRYSRTGLSPPSSPSSRAVYS